MTLNFRRRFWFVHLSLLLAQFWCASLLAQSVDPPTSELIQTAERVSWTSPDSALSMLLVGLAEAEADPSLQSVAIKLAISKVYNFKRICDSIDYWNDQAEETYLTMDHQRGIAETWYQKGYASFCRMEYELALEQILEGLEIMERLNDERGIALGHLRMSRIFHFTFKMKESAEHGRLGGQGFEQLGDYADAWDAWSFAGHGYRMENDSAAAIECFDKCMEMAVKSGIPVVMGLAYNDLASFYMEYDQYDSAAIYFEKSLEIVDPSDERQVMVIKNGLGQVYLHTGQYQKCIDLLYEALSVVEESGELFFMTEIPEYIAQSYAGLGQYDSAYKYMEMNWRYSDSLFTQNQDEALQEMKTKYESDQKDALISRQKAERKYGIALFLAVLAVAILFYMRYRSKQKMNNILDQRNKEKDFLLKEIHHRVKNNLQILSSLLNLQSEYIEDEKALDAITEGGNRVQSMSFIHQQLYSHENVTAVDMRKYLSALCEHLSETFSSEKKVIDIKYSVEQIFFDVETAIPLGLIINELITNSIKYAFGDRLEGNIQVDLWITADDQLGLKVADDGPGVVSVNDKKSTSFGKDLIEVLSQKLKGKITVDTDEGYSTTILFKRYKMVDPKEHVLREV